MVERQQITLPVDAGQAGESQILPSVRVVMVEITENLDEVAELRAAAGFVLFGLDGTKAGSVGECGHYFAARAAAEQALGSESLKRRARST